MIGEGTLSSAELTESLFRRIRETEPRLKAYVTLCEEDATRMAEAADREVRAGRRLGPLHGIPVSVKDLVETKGVRTTAGSKHLSSFVPEEDATAVRRLKGAGAIVVGKTNTHEFALGGVTPPTCNPWDLGRIPGGSSGGSAAAIAAASAFISLGSDTGGSIRIPAAFCGVVGLKPTYGRVSKAGVFPESWSLDHLGPITKTVEDCALLMNVLSGYDQRDPASSKRRVPDFADGLPESLDGVRVGVPENYFFESLEKGVRSAVGKAVEELEGLGARVEPVNFPMIDEIMGAYTVIDLAEVSSFHEDLFRADPGLYQEDVRAQIEIGFFVPALDYLRAQRVRGYAMPKVRELFRTVDVLATASQPMVAPKHRTRSVRLDGRDVDAALAMVMLSAPFNLTGLPALSVPCGFSGGLPVGLQLVGDYFQEKKVLGVGGAYERAAGWYKVHPHI